MWTLIYCAYNKIIRTQLRPRKKRAQHRGARLVVCTSCRFRFRISLVLAGYPKELPRAAHRSASQRIAALGLFAGRVHSLVFAESSTGIRVISFRKANSREVKRYEQETQS